MGEKFAAVAAEIAAKKGFHVLLMHGADADADDIARDTQQ